MRSRAVIIGVPQGAEMTVIGGFRLRSWVCGVVTLKYDASTNALKTSCMAHIKIQRYIVLIQNRLLKDKIRPQGPNKWQKQYF
jgi:hypothetical protein